MSRTASNSSRVTTSMPASSLRSVWLRTHGLGLAPDAVGDADGVGGEPGEFVENAVSGLAHGGSFASHVA
jgi:hypothetical protein